MQQPTLTYIVWLKDCYDEAEEVSMALNGETLPAPMTAEETPTAVVFIPIVSSEQNAALEDIAHLLKRWFSELTLSNYEEYLESELSDEDAV